MGGMKYLVYGHQSVTPWTWVLLCWIWTSLRRRFTPVARRLGLNRNWRRIVGWTAVAASLVVQAIMLYILGELVDVCISLMELWAELASYHFAIVE